MTPAWMSPPESRSLPGRTFRETGEEGGGGGGRGNPLPEADPKATEGRFPQIPAEQAGQQRERPELGPPLGRAGALPEPGPGREGEEGPGQSPRSPLRAGSMGRGGLPGAHLLPAELPQADLQRLQRGLGLGAVHRDARPPAGAAPLLPSAPALGPPPPAPRRPPGRALRAGTAAAPLPLPAGRGGRLPFSRVRPGGLAALRLLGGEGRGPRGLLRLLGRAAALRRGPGRLHPAARCLGPAAAAAPAPRPLP